MQRIKWKQQTRNICRKFLGCDCKNHETCEESTLFIFSYKIKEKRIQTSHTKIHKPPIQTYISDPQLDEQKWRISQKHKSL